MFRSLPSPRKLARAALLCPAATLLLNVACVRLPRRAHAVDASVSSLTTSQTPQPSQGGKPAPQHALDINRATRDELATLPGIGEGLAARIVDHRARFGAFRRAEHLLMVRGISERRFARLRPFVVAQ